MKKILLFFRYFFNIIFGIIWTFATVIGVFYCYVFIQVKYIEWTTEPWEYHELLHSDFVEPKDVKKYYEVLKKSYNETIHLEPLEPKSTQWRG